LANLIHFTSDIQTAAQTDALFRNLPLYKLTLYSQHNQPGRYTTGSLFYFIKYFLPAPLSY